jgi:hypothetical protein
MVEVHDGIGGLGKAFREEKRRGVLSTESMGQ